jgi:rod shape-determining protein MreB
MLNWLRQQLSDDLAIDLGTSSTRIGLLGHGLRLDEPSVVAVGQSRSGGGTAKHNSTAVGKLAHQMLGRTPDSIRAVRPIAHGVISDFEMTESMLRFFLQKATGRRFGLRPRIVIAVPGCMTAVERRAVINSTERAGGGQIWLVEKARAAGIGAGPPVSEPVASMVCDIGGGTTEAAVLSLGDIVASRSVRTAGDEFDQAIVRYLRRRYSLRVGVQSAEELKIRIGSAAVLDHELSREISGLDVASGIPRRAMVTSEEIREAVADPLREIVDCLRDTIERSQPELIADLADTGLVLTGGSAQLRGIDRYLSDALGIPVRVAEQPRLTVARGVMICLDHLEQWQNRFEQA